MTKRTPGPHPGTHCGACGRSKADQPDQFRIRRRRGREALHYMCKPCEADQRRAKQSDREQNGAHCTVDGCTRAVWARGWCPAHYSRWRGTGETGSADFRPRGDGTQMCGFPDCGRPHLSKGLCAGHYHQKWAGKVLRPIRPVPDVTARDEDGRKCCTSCGGWLTLDSFSRRNASPDGLSPSCKRCHRSSSLKRHFGLTLDEYEQLLAAQGGGCAVCGRSEPKNGRMLAVDHDHTCCPGRVTCGSCIRGLLCSRCNLHLGAVGDNVAHIEAMAAYLRNAQAARR